MKPFPAVEQLAFLLGNELGGISIGPYQLEVFLAEGSIIRVEHGLEYVDSEGRMHQYDPQRRSGPDPVTFHELIGDRIARVEAEGLRLVLIFASGRNLTILSEEGPYESGHIVHVRYDERGISETVRVFYF
jgi:hypothetical protein